MGDDSWQAAFGEKWDAIVLGTGLKECLLSGLLSVAGKKVLHLDRNSYYGGASASLDIHQFWKHFGIEEPPSASPALAGPSLRRQRQHRRLRSQPLSAIRRERVPP